MLTQSGIRVKSPFCIAHVAIKLQPYYGRQGPSSCQTGTNSPERDGTSAAAAVRVAGARARRCTDVPGPERRLGSPAGTAGRCDLGHTHRAPQAGNEEERGPLAALFAREVLVTGTVWLSASGFCPGPSFGRTAGHEAGVRCRTTNSTSLLLDGPGSAKALDWLGQPV